MSKELRKMNKRTYEESEIMSSGSDEERKKGKRRQILHDSELDDDDGNENSNGNENDDDNENDESSSSQNNENDNGNSGQTNGEDDGICMKCKEKVSIHIKSGDEQAWFGCDKNEEHWWHEQCLTRRQLREAERNEHSWTCPYCRSKASKSKSEGESNDEHNTQDSEYVPSIIARKAKKKNNGKQNISKSTKNKNTKRKRIM